MGAFKRVDILSGIPGVGKSTLVDEQRKDFGFETGSPSYVVCSADHYFMVDGVWKFNPREIGAAHQRCLANFLSALTEGPPSLSWIVVDNTNTTEAEIAPYYSLAELYGWDTQITTIVTDTPILAWRRNIHGVPLHTVLAMDSRIRDRKLPPWWRQEMVAAKF